MSYKNSRLINKLNFQTEDKCLDKSYKDQTNICTDDTTAAEEVLISKLNHDVQKYSKRLLKCFKCTTHKNLFIGAEKSFDFNKQVLDVIKKNNFEILKKNFKLALLYA